MGSVRRKIKKTKRAFKRPISKITKGIAKGIAKVGKSVMRGVAKLNKKLGPLGTIALSMAMPYALGGLTKGFTSMANVQGQGVFRTFIRSAGEMGLNIGKGFSNVTGQISKGMSSITDRITKGFSKMGQGNNIFSRISNGVKRLYNSAKTKFGNTFGKKASAGKVEVFSGTADGPMLMDVTKAAEGIRAGTIDASQLGTQFAGDKAGFFTKQLTDAQLIDQNLISSTINDAYSNTLNGYSDSAMRFFTDVKKQAIAEGTYVNDLQICELLKNNGLKQNVGYKNIYTDIGDEGTRFLESNFDIGTSKNYKLVGPPGSNSYEFTGNEMFKTPKGSSTISKKFKEVAMGKADSLLKNYRKLDEIPAPYMIAANQDMTMQTSMSGYGGSNIEGSEGGDFIAAVYGDADANAVKNYYKKMNILGEYA